MMKYWVVGTRKEALMRNRNVVSNMTVKTDKAGGAWMGIEATSSHLDTPKE